MRKPIEISKEDLREFYVTQNHTERETAAHFKCSVSTIQRKLRQFDIWKFSDAEYALKYGWRLMR